MDKLAALVEDALPEFETAGEDLPLYVAYFALGEVEVMRGRMEAMADAFDRAAEHARTLGPAPHLYGWRASGRVEGPTPVSESLAWLDEQDAAGAAHPLRDAFRAQALAMLGRFDQARALLTKVRAELADRGAGVQLGAMLGLRWSEVERLAGDPAAAAEVGQEGCRLLDELGEHGFQSTAAGYVAQAFYAMDRLHEADDWAVRAAQLGGDDDMFTQMLSHQVRAKVAAQRGERAEAEQLAREAVRLGEETDAIDSQAWTYADLGEVLALAARREEAAEAFEEAMARYEQKGNVVMAERTRDRLAALRAGAAI